MNEIHSVKSPETGPSGILGSEKHGAESLKDALKEVEREGKKRIRQEKQETAKGYAQQAVAEQEKIANFISLLYAEVAKNPDLSALELLMLVSDKSGQQSLNETTSEIISNALDSYERKHKLVNKYTREYKNPRALYQLCFGKKPIGKVEVVPGAMTVCFRCFDEEDYIHAYTHTDQPVPHTLAERKQKAKLSAGAALPSVMEADLNGCVILEKASHNSEWKEKFEKNIQEIAGRKKSSWQNFQYPKAAEGDIMFLRIEGLGEYDLNLNRSKGGLVTSINIYKDAEALAREVSEGKELRIDIPTSKREQDQYVIVRMTKEGLKVYDHSQKKVEVEQARFLGKELVIKDKSQSRRIRIHEEQHQFNKLFVPNEQVLPLDRNGIATLVVNRNWRNESEVRRAILHRLALNYRQGRIDSRARDEIIAYYKQGMSPLEILNILKSSKLYQYQKDKVKFNSGEELTEEEYIASLIKEGLKNWDKDRSIVVFDKYGRELQKGRFYSLLTPEITGEDIEKEVAKTLTGDYYGYSDEKGKYHKGALDLWTEAVAKLDNAGLSREKIISFLSMLPANRWRSFTNRLNKITKKEQE